MFLTLFITLAAGYTVAIQYLLTTEALTILLSQEKSHDSRFLL